MRNEDALRRIVKKEVTTVLREDLARGIPDFVLRQVASDTGEALKRHLKRHIQMSSTDPAKQRQMYAAANVAVEELEEALKDLLEDKLQRFLRST